MKKTISYIASIFCFWIGDLFCRISYLKFKGKFLFDKPRLSNIGMWLCGQYQKWMQWSTLIQDWGGNKKPWVRLA